MKLPEEFKVLIITLSDRAFRGEYKDLSGPLIKELTELFFQTLKAGCHFNQVLLPDDETILRKEILNSSDKYDIIFTTGGTGIGPRDITVETISPLLTKEIPGVMEYIRVKYGSDNPNALLSRGIAGLIGRTLVYTLPGSARAVSEYMTEILKTLEHTLQMLHGIDTHKKV
jgi:molybdopterin adenylyltransferase